jgi:hypothetical protein
MERLTENQQKIVSAIWDICSVEPFATAEEIAEMRSLTKQTVLNNIDEVIEARGDIQTRKVGQANVYYEKPNRMDELQDEHTEWVHKLHSNIHSTAAYAKVVQAAEGSDFDYVVEWYSHDLEQLHDYQPSANEMGQAMAGTGAEPVAIKFHDELEPPTELEDLEEE